LVSLAGDSLIVDLGQGDAITLGGYFSDGQVSIGILTFSTGETRDIRSWFWRSWRDT
jgi:hypothetical protein